MQNNIENEKKQQQNLETRLLDWLLKMYQIICIVRLSQLLKIMSAEKVVYPLLQFYAKSSHTKNVKTNAIK